MVKEGSRPAPTRGVALFGGDPAALGWCALPEAEVRRAKLSELPEGEWWTDLSPLDGLPSGVLTASYLPVTHAEAVHEWGYGRRAVDLGYAAGLCATLFARIMAIADRLDGGSDSPGTSLSARLARALPFEARGDGSPVVEPGYARMEPGRFRRDRGLEFGQAAFTAARELMETPVPEGPVDEPVCEGLGSEAAREMLRGMSRPCLVDLTIRAPVAERALGVGALAIRRRVAHPEFILLSSLLGPDGLEVHGALAGTCYGTLGSALPARWRDFMDDDAHAVSWSSGIVAEAMLEAVAAPHGRRRSWQGEWMASAGVATAILHALRLDGEGYRVGGIHGHRIWLDEPASRLGAAVRDCAAIGLMPGLTQIPVGFMPPRGPLEWQGPDRDRTVFEARVFRDVDALWNLDRLPLIESPRRGGLLKAIHRNSAEPLARMPQRG